MCCIFKYFSWTVDFIQRIWTFLMSCCIAGAICCLFFVASMAGIALGYNYSIAEFITLRNSQASVFVKRDVTDDTSRGIINRQHSKSEDQRRPFSDQEQVGPLEHTYADSFTSNKQPYNVAFEADGENKYERLLLPLITKSLDIETATVNSVSKELGLEEIIAKYPSGSVDQMKAILNYIYLMKLKKHWRSSTKVIAIKKYLQDKENETITDENVTFLADYDETELKNWRRVVPNNNIYSIAERPKDASSSQDVDKLPKNWVNHNSSVQKAAIRNRKSETDFKTTLQLHMNTRSKPNRRKIYTMTRTIPTYIVPKKAFNVNNTFQDNVVGVSTYK